MQIIKILGSLPSPGKLYKKSSRRNGALTKCQVDKMTSHPHWLGQKKFCDIWSRSPEGHAARSMHIKGQEEVWIGIQVGQHPDLHFRRNRSNKLDYFIILSWKGFPVTNTLTYWACFVSYEENESAQ
jgi:hypothetical protein